MDRYGNQKPIDSYGHNRKHRKSIGDRIVPGQCTCNCYGHTGGPNGGFVSNPLDGICYGQDMECLCESSNNSCPDGSNGASLENRSCGRISDNNGDGCYSYISPDGMTWAEYPDGYCGGYYGGGNGGDDGGGGTIPWNFCMCNHLTDSNGNACWAEEVSLMNYECWGFSGFTWEYCGECWESGPGNGAGDMNPKGPKKRRGGYSGYEQRPQNLESDNEYYKSDTYNALLGNINQRDPEYGSECECNCQEGGGSGIGIQPVTTSPCLHSWEMETFNTTDWTISQDPCSQPDVYWGTPGSGCECECEVDPSTRNWGCCRTGCEVVNILGQELGYYSLRFQCPRGMHPDTMGGSNGATDCGCGGSNTFNSPVGFGLWISSCATYGWDSPCGDLAAGNYFCIDGTYEQSQCIAHPPIGQKGPKKRRGGYSGYKQRSR